MIIDPDFTEEQAQEAIDLLGEIWGEGGVVSFPVMERLQVLMEEIHGEDL